MPRLLAHQLLAGPHQRAQSMQLLVGNEARLDQAVGGEIGDPHRVVHVGLAAGNRLDVRRVGDDKLESRRRSRSSIPGANRPRSPPSPPPATAGAQPVEQGQKTVGCRLVSPAFPRRLVPRHRAHARNHGVLVNVQTGNAIIDHSIAASLPITAGEDASQTRNPKKQASERRRP